MKLDDKLFKSFVVKYTEHTAPSSSVLRKKYIKKSFTQNFQEVQRLLENETIYVSLDGTTDKKGKNVAAFIVGSLGKPNVGPFLINLKEMENGTGKAYYEFFKESLDLLFEGTRKL